MLNFDFVWWPNNIEFNRSISSDFHSILFDLIPQRVNNITGTRSLRKLPRKPEVVQDKTRWIRQVTHNKKPSPIYTAAASYGNNHWIKEKIHLKKKHQPLIISRQLNICKIRYLINNSLFILPTPFNTCSAFQILFFTLTSENKNLYFYIIQSQSKHH